MVCRSLEELRAWIREEINRHISLKESAEDEASKNYYQAKIMEGKKFMQEVERMIKVGKATRIIYEETEKMKQDRR